MKSTKYLYNCEPIEFINMSYKKAIDFKLQQAKELIATLMSEHYTVRDDQRVKAVFKAIKFNTELLKELND